MSSFLPSTERGYLPLYVLLLGVTALGNVVQCYTTLSYTQRLYAGSPSSSSTPSKPQPKSSSSPASTSPVTPLSARTFGTWNIAVGVARLFAAYHMTEPSWYAMSIIVNLVGLWHFGTEAFVYGTCQPKGPWLAPISMASIGLVWHFAQWGNYVN